MMHVTAKRLPGALAALALTFASIAYAGCSKSPSVPNEQSCSGAQALSAAAITGATLPLKTLALTFDDGPGARTLELSAYLKGEGIRAVFFVWGQALENDGAGPDILQRLVADGHLIGNHTETHRSLTQNEPVALTDQEVALELTKVDEMISPFVKDSHFLFRPPYGQFDQKTFDVLQKTDLKKYVGPILWDVGGTMAPPNRASDAECWKPATLQTVRGCGDLYLKEIDNVGKGIVLLHDPYFIEQSNPESGGTYQMIQYMVPILKQRGYAFVRADEVPAIAKLLPGGAGAAGNDAGASPGVEPASPDPNGTGSATDGTRPCP
jgi:peptidoglycan/xylan/chitin deacetylase (PgdA/CDA1 family)